MVLLITQRRWTSILCLLACSLPAASAYGSIGALFGTVEDKFTGQRLGGGQNGYPRARVHLDTGSLQA